MADKLSEQVLEDLSNATVERVARIINDVLQLVNSDEQKITIALNVAAYPFGISAALLHAAMPKCGVAEPKWASSVEAAIAFIARIAIENPPESLCEQDQISTTAENIR